MNFLLRHWKGILKLAALAFVVRLVFVLKKNHDRTGDFFPVPGSFINGVWTPKK